MRAIFSRFTDQLMKQGTNVTKRKQSYSEKYSGIALEMRLPNTYWWNHCNLGRRDERVPAVCDQSRACGRSHGDVVQSSARERPKP